MTIQELSEIMVKHNLSIRAIPKVVKEVYEESAKGHMSGGKVEFLPKFKRNMYVRYTTPEDAGKFMCVKNNGTLASINFAKVKRFNTVEEAVEDYLANLPKHS